MKRATAILFLVFISLKLFAGVDTCQCIKVDTLPEYNFSIVKRFSESSLKVIAAKDTSSNEYYYLRVYDCCENKQIVDFWDGDHFKMEDKKDTLIFNYLNGGFVRTLSGADSGFLESSPLYHLCFFEKDGKICKMKKAGPNLRKLSKGEVEIVRGKYLKFSWDKLYKMDSTQMIGMSYFQRMLHEMAAASISGDPEAGKRLENFEKYYGTANAAYGEILGDGLLFFGHVKDIDFSQNK